MPRFRQSVALALIATTLIGCAMGPKMLRRSRVQYNQAVQRTQDQQLLLNLVRLRYCDTPAFLEVASVSEQYTFGGSGSVSNRFINAQGWESLTAGLSGDYTERPTISYTPLQGHDFVQRLFVPIPLERIIMLQRSGWSVERVMRLCVQDMNGLPNAPSASGPTPATAPEFAEFVRAVQLMRVLQSQRQIELGQEPTESTLSAPIAADRILPGDLIAAASAGYRFAPGEDEGTMVLIRPSNRLVLDFAPVDRRSPEAEQLLAMLGISPRMRRVPLAPSGAGRQWSDATQSSLAITTRSLMGTLFYLSHAVEIPAEHLEQGEVTITRTPEGIPFDWREVLGDLLLVQSSVWPPAGAAIAVEHRGHWFYIDDADLSSKATFALLSQLFSLQAGEVESAAPVLTLPIGG